ncbi:hypothetical protein T06_2332 [Trichinella sp. T6]|nr:hypothetical protein T06_2332 [Trichinella sp. T6]
MTDYSASFANKMTKNSIACSRYYELFETTLEFFQNKDRSLRDSLKNLMSLIYNCKEANLI